MSHEAPLLHSPELIDSAERRRVLNFRTAKGSIYTYDEADKTTRFKAATGEQRERMDLTVFLPLSDEQRQKLLDSMQLETRKVYVIERLPTDQYRILRDIAEVHDPSRVYLGVFKGGEMLGANPVSLQPVIGYNVFDTRHYETGGHKHTAEYHLGNKVTEINYED